MTPTESRTMRNLPSSTPNGAPLPEPTEPAREIKFTLSESDAIAVAAVLRRLLPPDPHAAASPEGTYRVESLYFDTDALDVFHRADGFAGTKYRARRYGENGVVFLEEKRKDRGLVRKRRTRVDASEFETLGRAPEISGADRAGDWFRERLRSDRLAARCQIAYERWARTGVLEGFPIRVTLDRAIACVPVRTARFVAMADARPIGADRRILEMKFADALPASLKDIVREFSLRPSAVSKYRLAIETCGLVRPDGPR